MTQARDAAGQFVSRFDPETVDRIFERIAEGEPAAPILRELDIPKRSFYDWLEKNVDMAAAYQKAREAGEEVIAADCLAIADDGTNDYVPGKDGPRFDSEHVQRSKLRIDTRLKLLAKWNPKKWGDKVEHSGKLHVAHEDFLAKLPDPAAE